MLLDWYNHYSLISVQSEWEFWSANSHADVASHGLPQNIEDDLRVWTGGVPIACVVPRLLAWSGPVSWFKFTICFCRWALRGVCKLHNLVPTHSQLVLFSKEISSGENCNCLVFPYASVKHCITSVFGLCLCAMATVEDGRTGHGKTFRWRVSWRKSHQLVLAVWTAGHDDNDIDLPLLDFCAKLRVVSRSFHLLPCVLGSSVFACISHMQNDRNEAAWFDFIPHSNLTSDST